MGYGSKSYGAGGRSRSRASAQYRHRLHKRAAQQQKELEALARVDDMLTAGSSHEPPQMSESQE